MMELAEVQNQERGNAWNEHISPRLNTLKSLFNSEAWREGIQPYMQMTLQMLAATQNPMSPPVVTEYTMQWLLAANLLMKDICIKFGLNDTSAYLPEPVGIDEQASKLHGQVKQSQQMQNQQEMQQQPMLPAGGGAQPPVQNPPNGSMPQ